jgi:Molecular chaperone, HSP90 family
MSEGNYNERGTRITLYLADDSLEFANEYRVKEVINKYCSFMPVEIYYVNEDEAKKQEKEVEVETKAKVRKADEDDLIGDAPADDTSDADTAEEAVIDAEDTEEKDDKSPKPLNDINPLWMKTPGDCKDEDYKDFYQKVFYDFKEPMFWIHLNMDYPFNLKGILYFPRINPNIDQLEGKVKLYNNQVFVADNIKEVIPEFLLVLKGVIDCPDLPLNVSRSALQNDGFVKKISDYITKKVADKLTGMFKTDREKYESLWEDISPFIKFGCLKDDKFNEKMEKAMIFRNLEGKYISLQDYLDAAKEKHENKVFYVSDEQTQAQYIEMFKKEEMDAIFLTHNIDNPYITSMEAKNEGVKFLRIDSDISDSMKGEELSEDDAKNYKDKLTETFKKALNKEKLTLEVRSLKDESVSSMILQSEDQRRMADMMKIYSMGGMNFGDFGADAETLVLNVNNNLVKFVMDNPENELTPDVCSQLYDLAVLANRPLTAEELTRFVKRSNELLGKVIS